MTVTGLRFWSGLTPRQKELLRELCMSADSAAVIAERIGCSHETVKKHQSALYDKSGMGGRIELMSFAWEHGIVGCPCRRNPPPQLSAPRVDRISSGAPGKPDSERRFAMDQRDLALQMV